MQMNHQGPTNSLVTPLLTDLYQISMTYGYWKNGKAELHSVFDLYFRKHPFSGEYCIFAGADEVKRYLKMFKFKEDDIDYLRTIFPNAEESFFNWLFQLNCKDVKVFAIPEGSVVFAKEPLLRIEGPLAICQLLETTLLNLVNFASLVATNAARMKLAAPKNASLLEFGLRRAQGPDGGVSATKYAFIGGFDATSNVLAGKLFGIAVKGTHAHAFVMCYSSLDELNNVQLRSKKDPSSVINFKDRVVDIRKTLDYENTNEGELAAFIAYALAFPDNFLALIDTYDTLGSGVKNFVCVALALLELGYRPNGVRLDSGDLAYLSKMIRSFLRDIDQKVFAGEATLANCQIVASNDINEEVLLSLSREGHEIDTFGIGTHLVTCQKQPALGCVYKLVEIDGRSCVKLSQDIDKMTIPGKKEVYRLIGSDQKPIVDLIQLCSEPAPEPGCKILVVHPSDDRKRANVTPSAVMKLLEVLFDGAVDVTAADGEDHEASTRSFALREARQRCIDQLSSMRTDYTRPLNPTPYKVSLSSKLHDLTRELWNSNIPLAELR